MLVNFCGVKFLKDCFMYLSLTKELENHLKVFDAQAKLNVLLMKILQEDPRSKVEQLFGFTCGTHI